MTLSTEDYAYLRQHVYGDMDGASSLAKSNGPSYPSSTEYKNN